MTAGRKPGDSFRQALARGRALVLDGGLATELEARGHDISTNLWSAALLGTNPQAITDVHRAYLDAGAECIISASYQASRQGFAAAGLSNPEADTLLLRAVQLAMTAREQFCSDNPGAFRPLVAASVGPYGAVLHDGSEYRGAYDMDEAALTAFHEPRLRLLDNSGADVLACETIPDRREADVLCRLLLDVRTPAWVTFSCRDRESISDGTPLAEVAARFRDHPQVLALGINCTAPGLITPLIGILRDAVPDKAVAVYPNSGENYDAASNSWSGIATPQEIGKAAAEWLAAGATLIGGCCRTGPSHIAELCTSLNDYIAGGSAGVNR